MMLMQVTCPHCGARYQFERSLIPQAGYDAQCANCSGIFVVAPDASGNEPPIALPSMSMIDTWLAPPALAPKSARTAAAASERGPRAEAGELRDVTPRGKAAQATVAILPRGGRQGPAASVHPGGAAALQFSIACPSCETVYAFAANDLPSAGADAACSQCAATYRLTRVGDPTAANDGPGLTAIDAEAEAAAEALRPIDPTVLEEAKSDAVGEALARDVPVAAGDRLRRFEDDPEETTTPNGGVLEAMDQRTTAKGGPVPHDEEVDQGSYDDRETEEDREPTSEDREPTTDDRRPSPDEEPTTDEGEPTIDDGEPTIDDGEPTIDDGPPIAEDREPTNDDREPAAADGDDRSEDVTRPFVRTPLAAAAEAADTEDGDGDRALVDAPTVVQARPGPRQSGSQVKVPIAVAERSRAGAASWGPPDPQTVMRSRVRSSRDTRERLKSRRPPFDDDDVQRLRRDAGGMVRDPREFDDEDNILARLGLLRGERRVVVVWVSAVVLALTIIFAAVPLLTGKSVLQVLNLRVGGDPRTRELLDKARAALLTDTDVGYRDALKAANDVLDVDANNAEARALYGIAAVFRGIDLRSTAQNMVAEGEVVQSSQMLAAASAELAHARRVLSRRNDESAELAFTAGIYYALDEDQREHARDAFVRGLRRSHVDGNSPAPTAFAAYLQATLRNLEGDAAGARSSLERAMELEPQWQRPRFELARLEAGRGEVGRARVLVAQVLAAQENHTKARDLLAVLPDTPADPGAGQSATAAPPEQTAKPQSPPKPQPQPKPPSKPDQTARSDAPAKTDSARTDGAKTDTAKADTAKTPPASEPDKPVQEDSTKPADGGTKPDPAAPPKADPGSTKSDGKPDGGTAPKPDAAPPKPETSARPSPPRQSKPSPNPNPPEIQPPPDAPPIIRGAPPPFQPPPDSKSSDSR